MPDFDDSDDDRATLILQSDADDDEDDDIILQSAQISHGFNNKIILGSKPCRSAAEDSGIDEIGHSSDVEIEYEDESATKQTMYEDNDSMYERNDVKQRIGNGSKRKYSNDDHNRNLDVENQKIKRKICNNESASKKPRPDDETKVFNKVNASSKVAELYKCVCGSHFTSINFVEKHFDVCNNNDVEKEYCSWCKLPFGTESLVDHLCKHHGNGDCSFRFVPVKKPDIFVQENEAEVKTLSEKPRLNVIGMDPGLSNELILVDDGILLEIDEEYDKDVQEIDKQKYTIENTTATQIILGKISTCNTAVEHIKQHQPLCAENSQIKNNYNEKEQTEIFTMQCNTKEINFIEKTICCEVNTSESAVSLRHDNKKLEVEKEILEMDTDQTLYEDKRKEEIEKSRNNKESEVEVTEINLKMNQHYESFQKILEGKASKTVITQINKKNTEGNKHLISSTKKETSEKSFKDTNTNAEAENNKNICMQSCTIKNATKKNNDANNRKKCSGIDKNNNEFFYKNVERNPKNNHVNENERIEKASDKTTENIKTEAQRWISEQKLLAEYFGNTGKAFYGRNVYRCRKCSYHFFRRDAFTKHYVDCSGKIEGSVGVDLKCPICNLSFAQGLPYHVYVHHADMGLKLDEIQIIEDASQTNNITFSKYKPKCWVKLDSTEKALEELRIMLNQNTKDIGSNQRVCNKNENNNSQNIATQTDDKTIIKNKPVNKDNDVKLQDTLIDKPEKNIVNSFKSNEVRDTSKENSTSYPKYKNNFEIMHQDSHVNMSLKDEHVRQRVSSVKTNEVLLKKIKALPNISIKHNTTHNGNANNTASDLEANQRACNTNETSQNISSETDDKTILKNKPEKPINHDGAGVKLQDAKLMKYNLRVKDINKLIDKPEKTIGNYLKSNEVRDWQANGMTYFKDKNNFEIMHNDSDLNISSRLSSVISDGIEDLSKKNLHANSFKYSTTQYANVNNTASFIASNEMACNANEYKNDNRDLSKTIQNNYHCVNNDREHTHWAQPFDGNSNNTASHIGFNQMKSNTIENNCSNYTFATKSTRNYNNDLSKTVKNNYIPQQPITSPLLGHGVFRPYTTQGCQVRIGGGCRASCQPYSQDFSSLSNNYHSVNNDRAYVNSTQSHNTNVYDSSQNILAAKSIQNDNRDLSKTIQNNYSYVNNNINAEYTHWTKSQRNMSFNNFLAQRLHGPNYPGFDRTVHGVPSNRNLLQTTPEYPNNLSSYPQYNNLTNNYHGVSNNGGHFQNFQNSNLEQYNDIRYLQNNNLQYFNNIQNNSDMRYLQNNNLQYFNNVQNDSLRNKGHF